MGLALASLALLAPATADAKARAVEPYKVLVVTSTTDEISTAGVSAITAAVGTDGTVTAPSPATVGGEFTPAGLDQYRAVVFLNTGMASPLDDAQRANFEAYYRKGGGFVGIGSAIETDASWSFYGQLLGARSSGRTATQTATIKVADRVHDATKSLPAYWNRSSEAIYNFDVNVRGVSHVLATTVVDPFGLQPQGKVLDGIAGGTMGADHPVSWCKDFQAGRSYYTALGGTAASFDADMQKHLKGAISWAAGQSDPTYSDCGATVLRNYQQTKISAPPNTNEPIGFDQLPDGRILQTDRRGGIRLHDPVKGTTTLLADFGAATVPLTQRVYTNSEDGMYGPAVDNDFATNKWVYLFYSPQTVQDVKLSDGSIVTQTTPNTTAPTAAPTLAAWDPYIGYFQLSRFKFVEDANGPRLDLGSEQQILRQTVNRQECCHVAGDIDFDKHNNLWLVTGDDTPAGGLNANNYAPANDQLTDEQQIVRVTNATGGTFTLTFDGQTTAPLPFNATAAQVDTALEDLSNIEVNEIQALAGPVNTANVAVWFRRGKSQKDQPLITADGAALTGDGATVTTAVAPQPNANTIYVGGLQHGGMINRPTGDARRGATNTGDLRGKLIRIKVKGTIGATDANKADFGSGTGAYTIPAGNLFPLQNGAPQPRTRPEIYAMGFRNPFRVQVDSSDVAYVSDYSPDANSPQRSRGPSGVGRYEIVRKPSNYGWPTCYSKTLGYYEWEYSEFPTVVGNPAAGVPKHDPPRHHACGAANQINDSRWVRDGGPGIEPGLRELPPVTDPDVWYSYQDNPNPPNRVNGIGTPCRGYYDTTPGTPVPGSATECPRLFPELFTGGVAAHGVAKYKFDPANPNTKKFPPYYDDSVILGEFGQDTMREMKLDGDNHVFKINRFLDCGSANVVNSPFLFECDNPMDMQWGADGAFYLLTYGDGFFGINPDAGMYKWEYAKGQRAPKAVIGADRTNGPVPLTVNFSSAGSMDDDPGESIRYEWDFGDGSPISEEANPTHTYTKAGRFQAVLTVIDSSGKRTSASTPITPGNTAPTVTVTVPQLGGTFAFGDGIPYVVTVTDPDDGTVLCSEVVTTFVLGHDTHGHGGAEKSGCSSNLGTSADDVSHGGNVYGIISATYTDKGGRGANSAAPPLTTIGQTKINQRKQQVEHVVSQSGTNTGTNTDEGAGTHRGSLAAGDWIQLNGPYNLVNIDSITYRVADTAAGRTAGSPLAAVEVRQDSITGPILATHNLVSTGGTAVWTSQTFPIAMEGTHEVFLVFRAVPDGQIGNNLFNLNYVEFNGAGITVVKSPPATGTVGGSVPATLSLTLGPPATFGAFVPGAPTKTYEASTTANVISSAGDAALTVAPMPTHLTNGAFSLPEPLQVELSKSAWTAPVSNETVNVTFKQLIKSTDPLRTGTYSKTLTFTLSTTTP